MIDVPNNLISAIGMLNGAANKSDMIWQIIKCPNEDKYYALLTPVNDENIVAIHYEKDHIDDLLGELIEGCN